MTSLASRREVALLRRIRAPRERVFHAWTDASLLRRWWGPKGFDNPVCEADPREGGLIRIVMRAPDGTEHPMRGVFREVVRPARVTLTLLAEDERGDPLLECRVRVELAKDGPQTALRVDATSAGLSPAAPRMLDGMEAGWSQSLDRLSALFGEEP